MIGGDDVAVEYDDAWFSQGQIVMFILLTTRHLWPRSVAQDAQTSERIDVDQHRITEGKSPPACREFFIYEDEQVLERSR